MITARAEERMGLEVYLTEAQIGARVRELGAELRRHHPDATLVVVGVLKGSFVFVADLVRAIPGAVRCEFLGVSSYQGTESTGAVRITQDLTAEISGEHVVLVEDIVDTGLTLHYLRRMLAARGPASLTVVALLDKPSRRTVPAEVDLVGFSIPDEFVVGYGLDLDGLYRNLPYIGRFRSVEGGA